MLRMKTGAARHADLDRRPCVERADAGGDGETVSQPARTPGRSQSAVVHEEHVRVRCHGVRSQVRS